MKAKFIQRVLSVFLCVALIMTCLPLSIMAAAASTSTSVADVKTLSNWEDWFPTDSSRYAGGVFIDKSVYTATEAKTDEYFKDISNSLSFGSDNFGNENFMIALSALGSNSEVFGYSHTPTDTMLVLDASTSMGRGVDTGTAIDDMVDGANAAIKRLLALNNYNRVGVVIYNGSSSLLLPLDRYTAKNTDKDILAYVRANDQNRISIASNVFDGDGKSVDVSYVAQAQGTFTQGGIYAAAQEFLKADTKIEDGKIQGGTKRLPIMVLMTDGEPSYRTKTGYNNSSRTSTINVYNAATNENADTSQFREDDITAFSTMLTAAWAEAEITDYYDNDARFYTLGYNLSADHEYAQNVLDPMNPNNRLARRFSGYATQYLAMAQNATATFRNENNSVVFSVKRASSPSKVTSLDYVDKYWQAAQAEELTSVFDEIVNEIIIQSRYYSTLVANNNYAQDGFLSFTDEIGSYMEVKDVKGLYIGDGKLISGGMFAEFITTGSVKDYDGKGYSDAELEGFENEILNAAAERFGISLSEASLLLQTAKDNGFISYTSPDKFSNYVAWYADEDNNYLAPYTNADVQAQNSAKYIVRSYFYMGDVTQNHVETSMLYALVRVREDIETGRQIVDMNVPAALLPLVTYTITVKGDVLNAQNVTGITCTTKKPISLLFEVGLDSEITPINITEKVGEDFRKDANGVYTFYTNRWRDDNGDAFVMTDDPDPHVFNHGIMNTTVAQFIPSIENERYYYTENVQLLDSDYNVYTGTAKPTEDGTFYIEYKWVEGNANSATLKTAYDRVSSEVLKNGNNIIRIDGKEGWFIKKDTPQNYFGEEVHGEQGHTHKTDETITNTLAFANYPQIVHHESESHSGYHILSYLGNNGLVKATPSQGIKLSKTVSQAVANAPDSFEFEIALTAKSGTQLAASYPVYVERANGTTNSFNATVTDGKISLPLADGDVAYVYDILDGTEYVVTEKYNSYYTGASSNASGTVALHAFSAVDFVNSPKGKGSLLVEKDVTHPFVTISDELANMEFDITVKFEGDANDLAQITPPEGSGLTPTVGLGVYTYAVKLKDGHDVLFTNIPEGVDYTVSENVPAGFTLKTTDLTGKIAKDTQSEVLLVNDYKPTAVTPKITISGEKTLTGRDWDTTVDKYQVALQQVTFGGQGTVAVGDPKVVDIVKANGADYVIDMSSMNYAEVGTYSYVVYEVSPAEAERVDSVSYDTGIGMFSVTVVDKGTGALSIDSVTAHQNTVAVQATAADAWTITKDFTNNYMAATVRIPVVKRVVDEDNTSVTVDDHRGGIMLALYASTDAQTPAYSTLTDANGNADIAFSVKQSDYNSVKYYYLREVIPQVDSQVVGMTYDTAFKYVIAVDWSDDTADAPTVKYYHYDANATNKLGSEITNIESTPLTVTNTYDDGVVSTPVIDLGGKKTLNGGALRTNDSFTFELYETDASFDIAGLTPKQTKTVNGQTANGAFNFDSITFKTEGTKYLVVAEKKGNASGIGYDTTRYHITVDVSKSTTDGNKTILSATMTHIHQVGHGDVAANALNFNNTYTINDAEEVTVKGNKVLHGIHLVEGQFTFGLYEQGSDEPLYTALNDKDGYFTFPTIKYNIVNETSYNKTYTYTVKEVIPDGDKKGVTYNSDGKAEYTVVVELKDDGNGGVTKTVKLDGQTVSDINVKFENSYAATGTSLTLSGTKTFNKDSGEFYFDLYETADDFAIATDQPFKTAKATVVNGSGEYSITLDYTNTDRGYHYYVLEEAVPDETNGVSYDPTQYYITVNALDNGHGEMEAHVMNVINAHTSDKVTVSTLDFSNKYVADSAEVVIKGQKNLDGRTLAENEFKFFLYPADETYAVDEETVAMEAKNKADGSFEFDKVTFDEVGIYYFVINEDPNTTAERVTNDNAVYHVAIEIKDDDKGTLYEASCVITKVGGDDTVESIVFNNVFTPKPEDVTVDIGVVKTVVNKGSEKIGPDGFEFVLEDVATNEKFNAKSDANGNAKFTLGYTEDDIGKTFTYKLTELNGGKANVTYSKAEYTVTVAISLNENNELVATLTLNGENSAAIVAAFENVYDYTPASDPEYPNNPQTGDMTNLQLWVALLFVSGGGIIGGTLYGRKRKTEEN